jgi:hypothetical protein
MKKQLVVALGLAVLATPAFASKARLQALGEDVNGSFYINDNRNVFLNAANVNNHKDLATFEWGDTTETTDGTGTPRAEGGVFKTMGNMVYGVYLGSESNTSNAFRGASGVTTTEENNIDLFVGGDAGMKWGANLTYSKSADDESDNDSNQQALRTRLGVIAGDIEGYANLSLTNKAESGTGATDAEFKGKLGYQIGAIYNLNEYRVFADYRSNSGEADGALDGDIKSSQVQVGAGRASKLNDKATLFTKASLVMVNAENDTSATVTGDFNNPWNAGGDDIACGNTTAIFCEEYKSTSVPVVIGLEYDAASWLTLRTSIAQTIWGKEEDKDNKRGFQDSTVVNAGATLKFGELSVDGVIGNSASVGVADADAGDSTNSTGDNTSSGGGVLRTDNLMSRVSMTYRF